MKESRMPRKEERKRRNKGKKERMTSAISPSRNVSKYAFQTRKTHIAT